MGSHHIVTIARDPEFLNHLCKENAKTLEERVMVLLKKAASTQFELAKVVYQPDRKRDDQEESKKQEERLLQAPTLSDSDQEMVQIIGD